MDVRLYMIGQKYKIFPEFVSMDEHEIYTLTNKLGSINPSSLTYKQWFWFHPSAYKLLYYGISALTVLMFGAMTLWVWSFDSNYKVLASIPGLIAIVGGIDLFKKLKNPHSELTTFYKMWLD